MTKMADTYYKQLDLLDPMERESYRILKTFKDNVTHQAFPSIKTLSLALKRCRNTTKKILRSLARKGYIHIKEQFVKHPVTNNKYNDTNLYTLLLDKNNEVTKAGDDSKREVEIIAKPKLNTIIANLKDKYNSCVVDSAVKVMMKNEENGSIIKYKHNYLLSLIVTADEQLNETRKAVEAIENQPKNKNKSKKQHTSKSKASKFNFQATKTKFHNFEGRTSKYTAEELTEKVMSKAKQKADKQPKSFENKNNDINAFGFSGLIDHSNK